MPEQVVAPGNVPASPHAPADENGRSKRATKWRV